MADETKEAKAALTDNIAKNRTLAVLEAKAIPLPTAGFVATAPALLKTGLRRIAANSEAEAEKALSQIASRGASVKADLGEDAPPGEQAAELLARRQQISETKAKILFLTQYIEEAEDINNSDIQEFLEATGEEYDHKVKKHPELRQLYGYLDKYLTLHGEAVREGRALAKEKKAESKK